MFEVPTNLLILLSILYGSISLTAVIGNSLVIWIVVTTRQMHTVTNFFIGNLAMADVIIGLFAIPFQFQAAVMQRWELPRFMCPFCPFIQILSVNVSIFTLTAIAIDRHKAILNPLRARSSKHASKIIIAIIWILAILLAAPISYGLRVVDLMIQFDTSEFWPKYTYDSIPVRHNHFFDMNLSTYFEPFYRFQLGVKEDKNIFIYVFLSVMIELSSFIYIFIYYIPSTEDNDTNITTAYQAPNITKPFCDNVNLSERQMLIYRYTLVLVQYIIPVFVISFVYIQVHEVLN
jgi:hypothetical protein